MSSSQCLHPAATGSSRQRRGREHPVLTGIGRTRLAGQIKDEKQGEEEGGDHYGQPVDFPRFSAVAGLEGTRLRNSDNPSPAAIQAPVSLPVKSFYKALKGVLRSTPLYARRFARRAYQLVRSKFRLFLLPGGPTMTF